MCQINDSTKRKPFPIGQSRGVTLPASMEISDAISMAASDRLIIMDTTGEVPQAKLLQFFMQYVEPALELVAGREASLQGSR